ncbi:MAG TPA: beta-propeller fold lactonase family protein [Candidatus Binataceae bacterium]|nr:beta-propeller fold lactonase family protein [Candidatus Binataceae bacterium]
MQTLDCRGRGFAEVGQALVRQYNMMAPGERLEVYADSEPADLKVWLMEAGIRYSASHDQDGVRFLVRRELAPALGAARGFHHVVESEEGFVWSCKRGPLVVRIDGHNGEVAAQAAIARAGSHLALDREAKRLFVADPEANEIIALRAADLSLEQRWEAPGAPQLPLVSAEGIVCVTGGAVRGSIGAAPRFGTGVLTLARRIGGRFVAQTVEVGPCPHDPLIASDEEHVFVPCAGSGELVKVRLSDGVIAGRVAVGQGPCHLVAHPDASRFYVANSWDGTVTCLSADGEVMASASSGGWAHAIDIAPDGSSLWVANFLEDTVAVFEPEGLKRLALLETEPYAHGLDLSPDSRFAVLTGFSSEHVRVFDVQQRQLMARVEVGAGSSHTAFVRDTGRALVACSVADRLACLDLPSQSLLGLVAVN